MKTSFVYILHCVDDSFYTGLTTNLEKQDGRQTTRTLHAFPAKHAKLSYQLKKI